MSAGTTGALQRLGVRLAVGVTTGERFRPIAVFVSGCVGAFVLLHTLAAINASSTLNALPILSIQAMDQMRWMVLVGVGMPALGLLATTARLSALARDRRLARLQLLGLTPRQTRLVALIETGLLLVAGMLVGWLAYLATRTVAAEAWLQAAQFPIDGYRAGIVGGFALIAAGLAVALLTAAVVVPRTPSEAWRSERTRRVARPVWRLLVLLAGLACILVVVAHAQSGSLTRLDRTLCVVGAVLVSAGTLLVAPVVTWLFGRLMLALGATGATRVAARRLQYQPVGSVRIVGSMIVALFMLALLQPLTETLRTDPVARQDRIEATLGPQHLRVTLPSYEVLPVASRILTDQGVTRIELATPLYSEECRTGGDCVTALVGTCWSLTIDIMVPDCGNEAVWLNRRGPSVDGSVRLSSADEAGSPLVLPAPTKIIQTTNRPSSLESDPPRLFVPANLPGVVDWLKGQPIELMVEGPGGLGAEQQLTEALRSTIPDAYALSTRALANYATAQNLMLGLEAARLAVIALGLLTFLFASVEQLLGRRATVRSLLVLGVGRSTLRYSQLLESLVPLLISLPAAIGLGYLTGAAFVDAIGAGAAWTGGVVIPAAAVGGVVMSAIVLLVLAVPRIDAGAIRRE